MTEILRILLSKNPDVRHTRNYMLGQVINKVFGILLMPLTTVLLGPVGYGVNTTFQAMVSLFVIFLPLCLYRGVTRFYYDVKFETKAMVGTQFLMMIQVMGILSIIALLTVTFWNGLTGLTVYLSVLIILYSVVQSIINFYMAFLQSQKKSAAYARYNVLLAILTSVVGVGVMCLLNSDRFMGLLYTNLFFRILFSIYALYDMVPQMIFRKNAEMQREVWRFCLPLLPHMVSGVLLNSIDKVMITKMVGLYEAGLYGFAYNFGMLVNIIVYAMNQTWGPEFYVLMNTKQYHQIHKRVLYYLNALLSCTLCIVLFSKEAVYMFARQEAYYTAYQIIPLISYGYVMFYMYSTLSNYAVYSKKTYFLSIITCICAAANIVMNYYGIRFFGYQIAALTTLLSYLLQYTLYYVMDRFFFHTVINFDSYFIKKTVVFIIGTYALFLGIDCINIGVMYALFVKGITLFLVLFIIWRDTKQRQ